MARENLLTPKQAKFVFGIIKGSTYSEAYKKAGFKVNPTPRGQVIAYANASRLASSHKVLAAIKLGRANIQARAEVTVLDLVDKLEQCRLIALSANPPQVSAAVGAIMGTAKILGLVIDKSEVAVQHRPAPLPTTLVELSEAEWSAQFDPEAKRLEQLPKLDFFD